MSDRNSSSVTGDASHQRVVEAVIISDARESAADSVDFAAIARFVKRYWLLIGTLTMLGGATGISLSYLFTKTYRAEVLVTPVSGEQGSSPLTSLAARYGGLANLIGIDVGDGDYSTAAVIAMLKSRKFIEQFIADERLLPELFPKQWNEKTATWELEGGKDPPTLQDGYDAFQRNILTVVEDKKTGLVTLRIEWRQSVRAAEWANALVARANTITRDLAIRSASQSVEYLSKELQGVESVELRQSIYSLMESQMNKRMLAATRPDFAFRVIDPAQPSSPRKYVRPKRARFAVFGLFAGALFGLGFGLLRFRLQS